MDCRWRWYFIIFDIVFGIQWRHKIIFSMSTVFLTFWTLSPISQKSSLQANRQAGSWDSVAQWFKRVGIERLQGSNPTGGQCCDLEKGPLLILLCTGSSSGKPARNDNVQKWNCSSMQKSMCWDREICFLTSQSAIFHLYMDGPSWIEPVSTD